MPPTIALGPFAIQVGVLVTLLSMWVGWAVASWLPAQRGVAIGSEPYLLLAVGIAGARLGFVAQYGTAYLEAPLSIFDFRDGGGHPPWGCSPPPSSPALWRSAVARW